MHKPDTKETRVFDGKITQQSYASYTETEHQVWAELYVRQTDRIQRYACREYLDGFAQLKLPGDKVANLDELNATVAQYCDWQFIGATGFLPVREFFRCLHRQMFPVTVSMRRFDELEFAELPDIFHDVFGHGPMLLQPEISSMYRELGDMAMRHLDDDHFLGSLAKLFWTVFETALIVEQGQVKVLGGALLSSSRELKHIFVENAPRNELELKKMTAWDYEVRAVQPEYVVINSMVDVKRCLSMLESVSVTSKQMRQL